MTRFQKKVPGLHSTNIYYDKLLLSIVKYQITMQDNKLIVLIVVVLHIKDAILSKKSKMSYSQPPYKFRYPQYQFIRNRESVCSWAVLINKETFFKKSRDYFWWKQQVSNTSIHIQNSLSMKVKNRTLNGWFDWAVLITRGF